MKKYTTIKKVRENINFLNTVEVYKPMTVFRKVVGYGLIYYGIATLPLPTGSVFAIGAGCTIVSIDYNVLIKSIKFYATRAINALYGLRNIKLIKYNLKLKLL